MPTLMGVGGDKRHKYFVLEESYRHFYYLTSDCHSEVILRLLCDSEKKAMLDGILAQDLSEPKENWHTPNNAMDGDVAVLFAYTCDMPEIKRCCSGVKAHGLKGALYCFDFQEEALSQICGPNVDIRCMDFEAVKRLL